MASSYDIGTGRITGYFTGGRADMLPVLDRALAPVTALGPFTQVNVPIVGTDNYDFMMQGVPNLVANQESANYGPNYHARTRRVRPGRPAPAAAQRRHRRGRHLGLRDRSTSRSPGRRRARWTRWYGTRIWRTR